jgi:hypothetical protein
LHQNKGWVATLTSRHSRQILHVGCGLQTKGLTVLADKQQTARFKAEKKEPQSALMPGRCGSRIVSPSEHRRLGERHFICETFKV